ncbi:J domain-containing protein [Evansella halocellulosilytica]|uniref:J domain-containing protein n=1 Tax=Evansella halocellulosilytica TaxID=2011013 RepID=UPI000BB999EB|nr:DnaJ domain-containing protein [Evansella halocellulosilytica]
MPQTVHQSYYKILGTTANISQRRIKEKYIAAVKKHPPETDPEQFELIREAYETLKDPLKRKQYDLARKYGGKIENILNKAGRDVEKGKFKQAFDLYNNILEVDPINLAAQTGVLLTSVMIDDLERAYDCFEQILDSPELMEDEGEEGYTFIYSLFSNALIKKDYLDKAKEILEEGVKRFPKSTHFFVQQLVFIYIHLDQEDHALEFTESTIPPEGEESFENIDSFMMWLVVVNQTENWSHLSKVQTRFRKFLKNLEDEDEKEEAFELLMAEYEEYFDHKNFRMAELHIDFAKIVSDTPSDLKEDIKEIKKLVRVEKDLDRLFKDDSIFPLILLRAVRLYFDDEDHPIVQQIKVSFPPDIVEELEEDREYFAAGILHLKKKYAAFYNFFKSDWDELFNELTKDFNREMKRGLRKFI